MKCLKGKCRCVESLRNIKSICRVNLLRNIGLYWNGLWRKTYEIWSIVQSKLFKHSFLSNIISIAANLDVLHCSHQTCLWIWQCLVLFVYFRSYNYEILFIYIFFFSFSKAAVLETINRLAPSYLIESYSAVANYLTEDYFEKSDGRCFVSLEFSPFHNERPGLSIFYSYKKVWRHISKIDDLYYAISIGNTTVHLNIPGQPDSLKIEMNDLQKLDSFASCLIGYYRLMCRWTFNLVGGYASPSLLRLADNKCHGPIGGTFAYLKLQQQQSAPGSFLIRQCEKEFDTYYIDIIQTELVNLV